jgi:hypothetical protein
MYKKYLFIAIFLFATSFLGYSHHRAVNIFDVMVEQSLRSYTISEEIKDILSMHSEF